MKLKILFLLLLAASATCSQTIDKKKIDDYITYIEKNNREIGSVSVFKDGKEVYNRSFGQGALEHVVYNEDTKYRVGSITKMITATLIFQLIEKGELSLDDHLSSFYPAVPNAEKITLKNLLEHSSGLGDFTARGDSLWLTEKVDQKEILTQIIKQGVTFEPGENIRYSNSGYYMLTRILEKKAGKSYAALVEEHIAKPLNLQDFSSTTAHLEKVFKSYEYNEKWNEMEEFEFTNVIGVGDIAATARDLNTFITQLFQYKILKKETIDIMKPVLGRETIGRGLVMIPFYDKVFYGHGGDTYGTHTMVAYNEHDKLSIAIAINGERFPHNDFAIGLLSMIYDRAYTYPEFKAPVLLKAEELDTYTGTYSSPALPLKLKIFRKGSILKAQGSGQPSFQLEYDGPHAFKFDPAQLKLKFIPNENKLIMNQMGKEFEMKRE